MRSRLRAVRRRARRGDRRARRPPIVVFQMGKVGSTTLTRSLRALHLPCDVHQVHLLTDLDDVEDFARRTLPNPEGTLREIARARVVRDELARCTPALPVISLVRDPVQRNVSAFFQNLTQMVPDAYRRDAQGELGVDELRDVFVDRYEHNPPLTWFQAQMRPVFGIDVFATPFDPATGCATYQGPSARLLVLRLEDLQRTGVDAVRRFLDLPAFELRSANVGESKPYAALYAAFREQVVLPSRYLDRMYGCELAEHFYTAEERAALRAHWEPR